MVFVPGIALFHALRKNNMDRVKLFSDMEHFDINDAKCTDEFDREFVLTAINEWYGNSEAFVEYVRGPMRMEMSKMVLQASTPLGCVEESLNLSTVPKQPYLHNLHTAVMAKQVSLGPGVTAC